MTHIKAEAAEQGRMAVAGDPAQEADMARIIQFPKIHPAYRALKRPAHGPVVQPSGDEMDWLDYVLVLLSLPCVVIIVLALCLGPLLPLALLIDVIVQVVRIHGGGMAALHGWLHLGALVAVPGIPALFAIRSDLREQRAKRRR
ncbi:hypothetical protein ACLB1G_15760 [Oxalobacteraceae bacterium A2-2]